MADEKMPVGAAPGSHSGSRTERRAAPVEVPAATPALLRELAAQAERVREREQVERRRMVRGLIVLALVVLALSMARAGMDRVFVPGWWRQW
jgi:hypothetical protein